MDHGMKEVKLKRWKEAPKSWEGEQGQGMDENLRNGHEQERQARRRSRRGNDTRTRTRTRTRKEQLSLPSEGKRKEATPQKRSQETFPHES